MRPSSRSMTNSAMVPSRSPARFFTVSPFRVEAGRTWSLRIDSVGVMTLSCGQDVSKESASLSARAPTKTAESCRELFLRGDRFFFVSSPRSP